MFRKLRRLRVPVCFYTCCSLCAILLFVSFNEDVKSLIQQNNPSRDGPPSGPQSYSQSYPPYSSNNARPLISSIPSGSSGVDTVGTLQSELTWQKTHQTAGKPAILPVEPGGQRGNDGDDDDVIKQYISDNFVGRRDNQLQPLDTERRGSQRKGQKTTNVISNLVKLAQQASNNPHSFNNINSLTGDATNVLAGGGDGDNELSQVFIEPQGTTSDTDLLYPSGDAHSQVRKQERQWFMTGGDYFPTPPGGLASIFYPSASWLSSRPSNLEYANLWYDNTDGSDRVIEQLMFAIDDPINYANISWVFDGPTATTVRPSASLLSDEPATQNDNEAGRASPVVARDGQIAPVAQSDVAATVSNILDEATSSNNINNQMLLPYMSGARLMAMDGSGGTSSTFRDPRLGKIKTILLYYGLGMSWGSHITNGRQVFLQQRCPVNACRLTGNRAQLSKADIVVFKDVFMHPKVKRPPGQLWIMYMLECPLNTQNFLEKSAFNMTATYRHDSDIVTPYEKWVYFDTNVRSLPQAVNYAEGKTKKVAWFVSNCVAKNNRLEYARELAKYIEVDIYGACGSHTCSRANARQCFEMLSRNYKFYLAFENSNCRDYISEKFFVNGLGNNVLPIVMGAHPDDYKRVSPDRSYIHVDDFSSPKELAQYLHELDTNEDLYNEYFKWKGTGEFINTHFFCRLCTMAHYSGKFPRKTTHYEDFNRWWRGPHVCTRSSWRSTPDIFAQEHYDTVVSNRFN